MYYYDVLRLLPDTFYIARRVQNSVRRSTLAECCLYHVERFLLDMLVFFDVRQG